jgi:hypothetical protein
LLSSFEAINVALQLLALSELVESTGDISLLPVLHLMERRSPTAASQFVATGLTTLRDAARNLDEVARNVALYGGPKGWHRLVDDSKEDLCLASTRDSGRQRSGAT